jgi:hypothetical protein
LAYLFFFERKGTKEFGEAFLVFFAGAFGAGDKFESVPDFL